MGYRLETSKLEYAECGGKLFGYISEEELHQCKSWQWLRNHGYLPEDEENDWDYGSDHATLLTGTEFKEFITLYVKDYNKLSPYRDTHFRGHKQSVNDFKELFNEPYVVIEWG